MFCQKCGHEVEGNAKFCAGCGADLNAVESENTTTLNAIIADGKEVTKRFFSKSPGSIMEIGNKNDSKIGIIFIFINSLLFGLVTCLNIEQVINHWLGNALSQTESALNNLFGSIFAGYITDNLSSPIKEISVPFELFLPLVSVALIITAIIIFLIYILFKAEKRLPKPFLNICNYIGLTTFPIIVALMINLIVGLVVPYLAIFFFVLGVLISLIYLYESLKNIFEVEKPIFRTALVFTAILIVVAIAISIGLDAVENTILDAISSETGGFLGELLNNAF